MKKWKGVSVYDYKDRRIARMNALSHAITFCQMHKMEPTLSQLFQIADKFLEYIYMDEPDPNEILKELDEQNGKDNIDIF